MPTLTETIREHVERLLKAHHLPDWNEWHRCFGPALLALLEEHARGENEILPNGNEWDRANDVLATAAKALKE